DSIVSLSNAANIPAKVLFKLTDGQIWISGTLFSASEETEIFEMNKRASADPESVPASFSQSDAFQGRAMEKFARAHPVSRDSVEPCFGYVFRADIDGFSALVRGAFSSRQALENLVLGFIRTTKD